MIINFIFYLVPSLVFLYVARVVYDLWLRHRSMGDYVQVPGHPIWRNYLEFCNYKNVIERTLKAQRDFGSRVRIDIFWGMCGLLVTDPKLAEFILTSNQLLDKGYVYNFFHRWLGMGLLTSTGEKWLKARKLLTPTFHFKILEQYVDVFNSTGEILITKLKKQVGKGPFDVFPFIRLFTLDVICETAMGTKVNAQENSKSDYVTSIKEMCRIVAERTLTPSKVFEPMYIFSKDYWIERRCLKIIHGYANKVIKNRKKELENNSKLKEPKTKRKLAFLDLLLECNANGVVLTDDDIREQVDTFMFEGHDTTASGIAFTLYCLAINPEVQQKVVEELVEIFGSDKYRAATFHDLQEMKYLDMVIKESMRLYPPVAYYLREPQKDVRYEDGVLPYGVQVFIFAYGLHRNPSIFPDPEKFDPERFTLENQAERSPFSYLTFSAGQRNCIGQKFAMLELKSTISKILRHFEVRPVEGYEPQLVPLTILSSLNGIQIQLKDRQ